ncbi:hypothetical protein Poli38472_008927 [Pythium oligandrum]|uniref:PHD-type domain-containing protein n=1 Tax=Pythium oligandrum TaxID=41045 RepID=A0A8K1FCX1_PYTOL|nr:hypothetical protein Poli38472_008927 [Pythium oligandrum]|eukprot:TMW56279.1 hypothetical protein Poli38472_008927 [Pythium oligandrum]
MPSVPVVPIRIGEQYQAELPALLSVEEQQQQRDAGPERKPSRQRWTPARFREEEVTEYLSSACRLHEAEVGLQCLYDADFDVNKAVQLLQQARRRKLRKTRQRQEQLSDEDFETAVQKHEKKFFLVKQQYPDVPMGDLVARFYMWKTSTSYARWRERQRAKKNKEAARLRQWADSESSEASDYHNEYCELCFTGGQLLCCDGCERAYHFSCVTPPIKDIPMGDWFCDTCSTLLGSTLLMKTSDENEYCDEVVLREGDEATEGEDRDEIESDDDQDDNTTPHQHREDAETKNLPPTASTFIKLESLLNVSPLGPSDDTAKPERPAAEPLTGTPIKSPLPVESLSNNSRKRQRKLGAPRRIPQYKQEP